MALKIIKLGLDTQTVIARFEAERQALALMDHPNIAKVFDAGATESGRPFFVMELVNGVKITDYCDAKNLSTEQRLELFVSVCQAVQHAHQKGIIHRDLKPSNILVAEQDGTPVPKVIDFGIAKTTAGQQLVLNVTQTLSPRVLSAIQDYGLLNVCIVEGGKVSALWSAHGARLRARAGTALATSQCLPDPVGECLRPAA